MNKIVFRGVLGKKLGENWDLKVSSVLEIFEAVSANISKSESVFSDLGKFCTHFIVFVDGKLLPPHLINSKILKNNSKVEILPVVQGGAPAVVMFVIGLALTALSMVLMKALSPKAPKDVKTSSRTLGAVRNVLNRNIVVPLGYGRMRVGSATIANSIYSRTKSEDSEELREKQCLIRRVYKNEEFLDPVIKEKE